MVDTTHIQQLIANALTIAEDVNGVVGDGHVDLPPPTRSVIASHAPVEHCLEKAAADLRHAAEHLLAERLSCLGWPQV